MKQHSAPGFFRIIALTVLLAGASGSVAFTLYTGRNNSSFLLMALFVIWVLSPFFAFLMADMVSKRWPLAARMTLCWLMLIVTTVSLLTYSGILNLPGTKPAFVFLVFPLISWLLLMMIIPIALSVSRKRE